jgi:SulP family sulfate permease
MSDRKDDEAKPSTKAGGGLRPAPWLSDYQSSWLRTDLVAGITVWALLVPQALAYGQLTGLPAVHGLYAAFGALALYALYGTSRHLNVGPEATVATLVATIITPLAAGDPERYLTLAMILAILTGVALMFGGILKLGSVTRLLSTPVLTGYITGSAIVIIIGQLDDLFGIEVDVAQYHTKVGAVLKNVGDMNSWDAGVGLATIAVLLILRFAAPKAPSYLIAVVLAIGATAIFGLDDKGATVVGEIEGGLPTPTFGGVDLFDVVGLAFPALAIALLAYVDSIATVKAVAQKEGYEIDPDKEFFGLAAANVGAGLMQGFSVNGSQSRSFTNADSGAKSQMSNWVGAVLILITMLFLTRPFEILPSATLAGIVIVVGIGLIDIDGFRRLFRIKRSDFAYAVITTVGVVWVGMLAGVFIAVVLSLFDVARRALQPSTAVLVKVPGTDRYADQDSVPDGEPVPGLIIYRFDGPLMFANVEIAVDEMDELIAASDPEARAVLFDAESVTDIDVTALDAVAGYSSELRERGIAPAFARVKTDVLEQIERGYAIEELADATFLEVDDGVAAFRDGSFGSS